MQYPPWTGVWRQWKTQYLPSEILPMPPSTPFKLDLLSASKYGTPATGATGARCNDTQHCSIPSNDVTRKVTEVFTSLSSYLRRNKPFAEWPKQKHGPPALRMLKGNWMTSYSVAILTIAINRNRTLEQDRSKRFLNQSDSPSSYSFMHPTKMNG